MRDRAAIGPRVFLSLLSESDIDSRVLAWFDDTEHLKYYSGSGRVFTRESILGEIIEGRESGRTFLYGIFDLGTETLIGTIKIGPIDRRNGTADLVAHVGDPGSAGKGLASEAISLGNGLAFDQHGVRKLYSGIFAANLPALRAYQRAGWVIEGVQVDQYLVDGTPMDRVNVACFPSESAKTSGEPDRPPA